MNVSIKIEPYGEARVTLDLGREFAQRVLDEMGSGDRYTCPVPGYYVYDFGDDWVVLAEGPVPRWPTFGPSGPFLCVGRVDSERDGGPYVFGISTEVSIRYPDLDYTVDPTELDLDARLQAARVLRLALTAFGVIQ